MDCWRHHVVFNEGAMPALSVRCAARDSFSQMKVHSRLQTVAKMPPFTDAGTRRGLKDVPLCIQTAAQDAGLRPPSAQFVHF